MGSTRPRNRFVLMKDAWWHFAPAKLKAELNNYNVTLKSKYSHKPSDDRSRNVKFLFQAADDLFRELFNAKPPIQKMVGHLLQCLRDGTLEAWGVITHPEGGLERRKIVPLMFDGDPIIKLNACTIENLGRKFEVVTIRRAEQIDSAKINNSSNNQHNNCAATVQRGRTSKSLEIERAIKELIAAGEDLAGLTRAVAYEKIRLYAKKTLKANISLGYSDPVIQRCMVKLLGKRI